MTINILHTSFTYQHGLCGRKPESIFPGTGSTTCLTSIYLRTTCNHRKLAMKVSLCNVHDYYDYYYEGMCDGRAENI